MNLPISRYVDITSAVGGAAAFPIRELMGRIFTQNTELATGTVYEFDTAAAVGEQFGTSSNEYLRALFYFSFVSKLVRSPNTLSFYRFDPSGTAAQIIGDVVSTTLGDYTSITDGAFALSIQAVGVDPSYIQVTGMNFSAASTMADIAAVIEVAIQGADAAANFTASTTIYDAIEVHFDFTAGVVGDYDVEIQVAGSGTDILSLIGWASTDTVISDGVSAQTAGNVLDASNSINDNFGMFCFEPYLTDVDDIETAAAANQVLNVKYQFQIPVIAANAQTWYDQLNAYGGTGATLFDADITDEFPEMVPINILGATNYADAGSAQNYMFYQPGLTPTVIDETDADFYDGLSINYVGRTQSAGELVSFYQRGVLWGTDEDPVDMNTYANEQWFKSSIQADIMNLLLAKSAVSANNQGKAEVLAIIQSTIELAKINGTISAGKDLTAVQQAYITDITGNDQAYFQVQNDGYYVTAEVVDTETIDYLLVYSKDDVVRKVTGRHVLI